MAQAGIMQVNHEFWDERAREFGHTGWANGIVYAYDQAARLRAIQKILESAPVERGNALDFGTGSGDFADLLARTFKTVVACDISREVLEVARGRYGALRNVEFRCSETLADLGLPDHSLDLIVSITVLGHLTNDADLMETLAFMRSKMRESGLLIALEYTPNRQIPNAPYQRFLRFDQWLDRFADGGFILRKHYGFHHPTESPCRGYVAYRRDPLVRALSVCQHFLGNARWIMRFCTKRAKRILAKSDDYYWEGREDDVLRIMLLGRSASEQVGGPGGR
jgi:SAM-dependent methyltransferase